MTKYLRFHTGAPLTPDAADSSFAVLAAGLDMPRLADFPQGTHEYPDRSATLVIQVPQVSEGGHVALRGPGIESTIEVTVAGMDAGFWREWLRTIAMVSRSESMSSSSRPTQSAPSRVQPLSA